MARHGREISKEAAASGGPLARRLRVHRSDALYALAMVVLGLIALIVVGPLREWATGFPPLTFAAALVLFAAPGALLAVLFPGGRSMMARVASGFVLSVGIFGLPGVLALLLHRSLREYLWFSGIVMVASLLALAAVLVLSREHSDKAAREEDTDLFGRLLWIPFAGLAGILAFISPRTTHTTGFDIWLYIAHVRDLLERDPLGLYLAYSPGEVTGFSRLALNGWLLVQAALARVSGIDPVALTLDYLAPTLVVLALLAFYGLALVLFERKSMALLAGCLYALFLLLNLGAVESPGGELIGRVTEDKFVARFFFLPVALGIVVLFLRGRGLRYLGLFFFVCLSSAAVHPLGPAFIGISVVGLCLLHVATRLRDAKAWARVGGIWGALLCVVVPPAIYLLATTGGLVPGDATESARSALQLSGAGERERLLMLGEGSYIMHPSLLLDPFILLGYLLGVPFLIRRYKNLSAQLLLGVLFFVPLLLYMPPVATAIGDFVGPWHLWRLAWPLPLAALLSLGWAVSGILGYAGDRLSRFGALGRVSPLLPSILVVLIAVGTAPTVLAGVRSADASGETPPNTSDCRDPVFDAMRATLQNSSVVLAPEAENSCVPAHLSRTSVVSYRAQALVGGQDAGQTSPAENTGVPQSAADVQRFFDAEVLDAEMITILQSYGINHVLVPVNSPLNLQLSHLPEFEALDVTGARYRLYGVASVKALQGLKRTPLVEANGLLNDGEAEAASISYQAALGGGSEDEWFLAYVGLGMAYAEQRLHADAAASYEQALALDPESALVYDLLASSYERRGNAEGAVAALERAVALEPGNAELKLRLADELMGARSEEEALEQYRAVVEAYPEVPEYRIKLGKALGTAGDVEAARREIERGVAANPHSARIQGAAGEAFRNTGRPKEALGYHERAVELEPEDPARALGLGRTYADLAGDETTGQDYLTAAEQKLREVANSDAAKAQRVRALISLAELYEKRGMDEEARKAYEDALKIAPGSRKVKKGLEGLGESS